MIESLEHKQFGGIDCHSGTFDTDVLKDVAGGMFFSYIR